jgi:tRNA nucleotidyltransferase/poly(A) polymerase
MNAKPWAPSHVRWVARTLEEAGYETWAVGGAIRNTLLGLPAGDWDLATRAPPPVVRRLFPRTVPVGIEHGTVGVLTREEVLLEVTTFRKDVLPLGRKAVVEFAQTLEEDLSRRDFTVNAIAWHPLREVFRDPFHGRADLEERLLRTVGDPRARFSEDYLRVLRALRFASRFHLRIDGGSWEALCAARARLGILSAERVREELMKVLAHDPRPSGAMALYRASGVLGALYPELAACVGALRPAAGEDLWVQSLLLMDGLPANRPLLRLVALLHGLGIPDHGLAADRDPGARGRERCAALMVRLRFSNAEIREVSELVQAGTEPPGHLRGGAELRRWLHGVGPDRLPALGRLWLATSRLDRARLGTDPGAVLDLLARLRREARGGSPLRLDELAVDGGDLIALGMRPGPRFGEILQELMEWVLDDPSRNRREVLLDRVREMWCPQPEAQG